jgi:hypothetical protein
MALQRKLGFKFSLGFFFLILLSAIAYFESPQPKIDFADYIFPNEDTSITLTEKKGMMIRHRYHRATPARVEDVVTVSTENGTPDQSMNTYQIEDDGIYLTSSHNAVSNQDALHVLKYPRTVQENHEYKNLGKVTRTNVEMNVCNLTLNPCIEFHYSGDSMSAKEIYCKGYGKISFRSETEGAPEDYECSAIAR